MNSQEKKPDINRRKFLHSAAAAGAGLAISGTAFAQTPPKKTDDINVAILGAGTQGQTLMHDSLKIPGIRFKAVCDIWEKYSLKRVSGILSDYHQPSNTYVDYREMLDKEKDLDAVIIATPDFVHAEHTVACLKAGLHVYCEKEMSNTIEGARQMVNAAKETGKLLQIGHQRRSNPRYRFCHAAILGDAKLLGKIAAVNGQWNRSPQLREGRGNPDKYPIDQKILNKYGYESMQQFREWRWYKKLGGGPIVDLGSHQIDIFSWFLGANPKSVMASGQHNYYDNKTHEWYDTVMALYEYETDTGSVTAFYQTVSSSGAGGYFETFMGDEGSIVISESYSRCEMYPNMNPQPNWDKWIKQGYLYKQCDKELKCIKEAIEQCIETSGCEQMKEKKTEAVIDLRESPKPPKYELPILMEKKYHQPHIENFFEAIRTGGKTTLNCPAEVGYETAVAVLKVNEAVEAGRKLEFKPDEFKV
jgi:predicted dehydrogenase